MANQELDRFIQDWERHAANVSKLLRKLPENQYDFRPDPDGRSLGELAWHLAEIEGYMTDGIVHGGFDFGRRPPGIERPREVAALAPGYERVHGEALTRIRTLADTDLDRKISFFDGRMLPIRDILHSATLHHSIHHAGQLTMPWDVRAEPARAYGPNREEWRRTRRARDRVVRVPRIGAQSSKARSPVEQRPAGLPLSQGREPREHCTSLAGLPRKAGPPPHAERNYGADPIPYKLITH
jgi:uncharacterized damage-inducible protein DinB